MCLRIDKQLTKKGLKGKRVHSNGMVKVWKVVVKSVNLHGSVHGHSYLPGWNWSNRQSKLMTCDEQHYNILEKGIHLFLTRKDARIYSLYSEVVLPVYVYKKDLLAVGIRQRTTNDNKVHMLKDAVFMKVFLKKEDYDKAMERKK